MSEARRFLTIVIARLAESRAVNGIGSASLWSAGDLAHEIDPQRGRCGSKPGRFRQNGAVNGIRTRDPKNHNLVL